MSLCDMMPVQDGKAYDACYRNDYSKEHTQSDHQDDIVPSLHCRPIGLLQEGLTQ